MSEFVEWMASVVLWSMLTVGAGLALLAVVTGDALWFLGLSAVAYAGYRGIERRMD